MDRKEWEEWVVAAKSAKCGLSNIVCSNCWIIESQLILESQQTTVRSPQPSVLRLFHLVLLNFLVTVEVRTGGVHYSLCTYRWYSAYFKK